MKVDYFRAADADLRSSQDEAIWAALRGFDGFFTSETRHDPFLPLAAAAIGEQRLDYGTAIAVAFARSPMVTAMNAWDLADLTDGRFSLGLGTQVKAHITRRFSMEWDAPGPRIREYVQALRAIWTAWQEGSKLDFRGEFYTFRLMTPFFDPGPIAHPQIPVFLAGVGPHMARVAGEVADGLHVHPFHTIRYLDEVIIPNLAAGAARSERSIEEIVLAAPIFVVTGRTPEEMHIARTRVAQQVAFYASTPSYRGVLELHGWDVGSKLSAMSKRGEWEQMGGLISDEILEEVAVVAPLDELGERVSQRYGNHLGRVGFYSLDTDIALDDSVMKTLIIDTKGQ